MELFSGFEYTGGQRSSRRRIIGFDVDGVLTDEFASGENIWQREIEAYFPGIQLLEASFSFCVAYGLSLNSVDEFMDARAASVFAEVEPQRGCKALMDLLAMEGFTIHLVPARDHRYKRITQKWLDRHGLPYEGLWFHESKGSLCQRLGIEVFVDDHWENCLDIADHDIFSLLMSAPHNLAYSSKRGIYRVEDWQEIDSILARYYGLDGELLRRTAGE